MLASPVINDPKFDRLVARAAWLLAIPSWSGFAYTMLHRSIHVSFPGTGDAWMPEFGLIPIATLVCGLFSLVCALPTLGEDLSSKSGWCFTIICALPFFGMLELLDPFGITLTH